VACPHCGRHVQRDTFCTECGSPLAHTEAPTAGLPEQTPPRPWWRRRRNIAVVAGGTVAAALLAGGVVTALEATGAEAVKTASATAPSGARVLPGWSTTATWNASGVHGRVAVTADGRLLGSATGDTVTVRTASTGTVLRTTTLDGSARGGVFAAMIDGRPALVAYTATTLTTWSGKHASPHTMALPKGGTVQIRTGALFVTAGAAVSVVDDDDLVPVTSPRSGAAPLGRTDDGRILWASARGEVITAAINGTILHTASLARPAKGAALGGWRAATPAVVWVRWTRPGKAPVLVAHRVGTGAAVTTTTPLPDGVTATSQDGRDVLVDGAWFTADGVLRPMPEEFVASRFVGAAVYGATTRGDAALLTGTRLQSAGIPDVVPVAVTAGRDLVTVTGGHIATYPPTTK